MIEEELNESQDDENDINDKMLNLTKEWTTTEP